MKKSQVTSLVLLLLLVVVANQAEAKREKFRRTVRGTVTVQDGERPGANIEGSVACEATVTYEGPKGKIYENELKDSGKFKTNSKGEFSVRLVFEDNVDEDWKFKSIEGYCTAYIYGEDVVHLDFEGKQFLNFDPIEL